MLFGAPYDPIIPDDYAIDSKIDLSKKRKRLLSMHNDNEMKLNHLFSTLSFYCYEEDLSREKFDRCFIVEEEY